MTVDEDFERELTRGLRDLVGDEHPPPELRERLADAIHEPPSPRRSWLPSAVAALIVVLVLGALLARDDAAVTVDLASEDDPAQNDADVAPSTTVAAPVAAAPSSTQPPEPAADDDIDPPSTTVAPAAAAPEPRPAPATTVPCRNSTDPVCGPFRWEPEPSNRPATVSITAPSDPIVAGEQVELTVSMIDPDGAVTLDCYSVGLDRPGLSTGTCSVTNPDGACPERYGPWTPPPPEEHEASTTTIVQFEETGTYEVSVDVSPADGCDNVDPYRSGATATITVEVVAPESDPGV